MIINFYEEDTESKILTIDELTSNPFSIGDVINLSVDDIKKHQLPDDVDVERFLKKFIPINDSLKEQYDMCNIKILRDVKYIKFNTIHSDIEIDYYCEIIK